MLHLSAERLAALAEDKPTAAESRHLYGCADCSAKLTRQLDLLERSRRLRFSEGARLTSWDSLAPALAAEGLVRGRRGFRFSRLYRSIGGVAAAFTILGGGVAAGRVSAGAPVLPAYTAAQRGDLRQVEDAPVQFRNTAEALAVFLRAERDYQSAAAYLAANDELHSTPRYALARLAALDKMNAASEAALREAPTDPVLNSYYVSTLSAREATQRQLNQVMPVGLRVTRY